MDTTLTPPTTPMRMLRIYTGPTLVRPVASRLASALAVPVELGTSHVYVRTDYSIEFVLGVLGPTWRWSDVVEIGAHWDRRCFA